MIILYDTNSIQKYGLLFPLSLLLMNFSTSYLDILNKEFGHMSSNKRRKHVADTNMYYE